MITAALANELAEAADKRTLSRVVASYGHCDLLCLDELNYVQGTHTTAFFTIGDRDGVLKAERVGTGTGRERRELALDPPAKVYRETSRLPLM